MDRGPNVAKFVVVREFEWFFLFPFALFSVKNLCSMCEKGYFIFSNFFNDNWSELFFILKNAEKHP